MDNVQHTYTYDGKLWQPNPTVPDKDSFFHATFGQKTDANPAFFDKQAKVRRMRWATFLTYFQTVPMPSCLTEVTKKCFTANEKYQDASVEDENQLENYVSDIIMAPQHVSVEEVQILSTLENVELTVLANDSVFLIKPNAELLGNYLNVQKPKEGVVLCLEGNIFSRLEAVEGPVSASELSDRNANETCKDWIKYDKGGSAGSKGVDYQVGILTIFLLNSLRELKDWRLSTENKTAGKFDDVVLEWPEGVILLQSKHKENKSKKITLEDLMSINSKNDDFSLVKYFFSYMEIKEKFNLKNIIICTNSSVDGKVLKLIENHGVHSDSMLFYSESDCLYYTFNEDILPGLKENAVSYLKTNTKNKNVDETMITHENFKNFLKHLQFFCNYPKANDIGKAIEDLLFLTKKTVSICKQITSLEIYTKVMDWFQQKNGVYLNEMYAKALFLEIQRDQRWHILEEYRVHFQKNDLNFPESKRILHVNVEDGYLLQEIKICYALKSHKTKILRLGMDDNLETYKQVIEAFSLPPYTVLIIFKQRITEDNLLQEVSNRLKEILDKYQYKRIVLVSQDKALLQRIKQDCTVSKEAIRFEDITKETQERLLRKEKILFQGHRVSLNDIIGGQYYEKVLSQNVLEKLILNEDIVVGSPLRDLKEDVSRFYIQRKFEITKEERRGTLSEEAIFEVDDKVVLISDYAGMGKTTVMTKLAVGIKARHPQFWVIRVELSDFTKVLRATLDKSGATIDILQLLKSKHATKLRTQAESEVFSSKGKVVLMLDGIDEISPDFTDLVLNMTVDCGQAENFAKIFVTTRPHMTKTLQALLEVKPFTLHPFTKADQIHFLTRYWLHNLNETNRDKCKVYAETLLTKTSGWIRSDEGMEHHFTAIPLQIRMLAEIFQERHASTWDGCKEFLDGNEEEPKLPEALDIVKLYDMFVERKRQVFVRKGNPSGNPAANRALNEQFEECLFYHRSLALEVIFGKSKSQLCSDHIESNMDLEINVLKMGIVQKIEAEFHFIHRTFAEYFVAQSLLKELQNQHSSTEFQLFFFDEVLLASTYHVTRAFLDRFLSNVVEVLPPTTFEKYQALPQGTDTNRMKIRIMHYLSMEGCSSILKLLFKCVDCNVARGNTMKFRHIWETCTKNGMINGNTLNILQYILEQCGVNFVDDIGKTPLDHAIHDNHLEMVKFLVSQGANVNKGYLLPVHEAVKRGFFEITKCLIEQGADMTALDPDEYSVLYSAIIGGYSDIALYVYSKMLEMDGLNKENHSIPHAAAYLGFMEVIKDFVEDGLDVNASVENEESVIFGAVRGKRHQIVEYLVLCGADVNKKGYHGRTPLHVASYDPPYVSTALLLLKLGADLDTMDQGDFTSLHIASNEGNFALVQAIVNISEQEGKLKQRLNSTSEMGSTPLYLAASNGHMDIVKFLVEFGADIHYRNKDGRTAIDAATFSHRLDIVEYFIGLGMYISATDNYKRTCLHTAAMMGQLDTVKFALKLGVDVNERDDEECTPIYLAAMWTHVDVVKFLAEYGADVNVGNNRGFTPVQLLAATGQVRMVEHLLKHGANVNSRDSRGCTPLHEAVLRKYLDVVEVLLRNKADVNIADGEGRLPLHLVPQGDHKMARLLGAYGNAKDKDGKLALDVDSSAVET